MAMEYASDGNEPFTPAYFVGWLERERPELEKVIDLMGKRAQRQGGIFSVQGEIVEVLLSIRLARLRN